jgi:hypothetical protein
MVKKFNRLKHNFLKTYHDIAVTTIELVTAYFSIYKYPTAVY